jgi:hypothetical protein
MRQRLYWASALIVCGGLVAAAFIYLTADDQPQSASYVIVGDTAYAVDPTLSKTYVRDLQRFGGKAAVLFDDFNRWFASRWQGKALGVTLGWLSVFVAALLFAIARRLPP